MKAVVALYDPAAFEQSWVSHTASPVIGSNLVGVFIEGYLNGYVLGVLTPIPRP